MSAGFRAEPIGERRSRGSGLVRRYRSVGFRGGRFDVIEEVTHHDDDIDTIGWTVQRFT